MPVYLKLGTVQGESKAKGHVGWIEVDSATFGFARGQRSGTSGENAPAVYDMTFTKHTDSSSAALFRMAAGGGQPQPAT